MNIPTDTMLTTARTQPTPTPTPAHAVTVDGITLVLWMPEPELFHLSLSRVGSPIAEPEASTILQAFGASGAIVARSTALQRGGQTWHTTRCQWDAASYQELVTMFCQAWDVEEVAA